MPNEPVTYVFVMFCQDMAEPKNVTILVVTIASSVGPPTIYTSKKFIKLRIDAAPPRMPVGNRGVLIP